MKRMHRVLRGRYPLAIFLVVVGGLAGALAGFALFPPKFESHGMINIRPEITGENLNDQLVPMIGMVMASQASIIQSTDVAAAALKDPQFVDAWKRAYPDAEPMAPADFQLALDAEHEKTSFNINVVFSDKSPEVAQAGTRSAIAAYMKLHGDVGATERKEQLRLLNKKVDDLQYSLQAHTEILDNLRKINGTTELAEADSSAQDELAHLTTMLTNAKLAYDQAVEAQGKAPPTPQNNEYVIQQIAASGDRPMQMMLEERNDAQGQLALYAQQLGVNHPTYKLEQSKLEAINERISSYLNEFLVSNSARMGLGVVPAGIAANPEVLKAQVDQLQKQVDIQRAKAVDIGNQRAAIDKVKAEIDQDNLALAAANREIQELDARQELTKTVNIVDAGSEAQPASNKRPLAVAVGFLLGGVIPLGLLLFYGSIDLRFRYSDDATEADLAGVTLLGILPNLPDRLSDPQQAGIAAHCVHQIRTMLQINRTSDEPQVLSVTSAAPGEGKTSLTLALGLSYAACGARTLLIDCDLVAAGLSHRLNTNAAEGILEAVASRQLLEYVRTTDIADVAILPVGTTHAHHASTLSPVSLRRLLNEAKKHFDIVLVDTGPILGSIEASLVCAAAERTILIVARGQQRPMVERSIGHLQAIGARLAGVVFNRAQPRDFERSLSGLALRSRPINGSGNGGGPSGSATPGSFNRVG